MTYPVKTSLLVETSLRPQACVIALHCSLGSGRQWKRLAAELGASCQIITPDLSGYGDDPGAFEWPTTLAQEVDDLSGRLAEARGPIHLIGHSYGGAVAFKIATASRFAERIRSLTLIEPVLPTLLCDGIADRRLHTRFVCVANEVSLDLWSGLALEAIDKFTEFWNGSGAPELLPPAVRLRMVERADKLAFDFTAVLAEENVAAAASALRVPTLLVSGGLSPYLTQRIVGRLASLIEGASIRHFPGAGHMLPVSHASSLNAEIISHIARADELAALPLAAGEAVADVGTGKAVTAPCSPL
jgi:pimeloyl-ACP methyl ester carboxylesterase